MREKWCDGGREKQLNFGNVVTEIPTQNATYQGGVPEKEREK